MIEKPRKIENIEINQVAIVEEFCDAIRWKKQREQLNAVRDFLRKNLKNALNQQEKVPLEIQERIFNQEKLKTLATVFADKYGVCLEWHVVGQVILNEVGIETVFRIGTLKNPRAPLHTYLDVKIDKKWEIFDPFAEKYLEDIRQKGTLFEDEYYLDSYTKRQNAE